MDEDIVCVKLSVYIAAPAALPASTLSDRLINSCARQRLVAASSRSTEEKVASRRGSGRHCRRASRARLLSLSLNPKLVKYSIDTLSHRKPTSRSNGLHVSIVAQSAAQQAESPCCSEQCRRRRNARTWRKYNSSPSHPRGSSEQ